jgi:hypothetical protein
MTDFNDLFKTATKTGLRFATNKGSVTTEDLWGLSLTQLNTVARTISADLRQTEEDFIGGRSNADTNKQLALEVVKAVIADKIADRDAATLADARRSQRQQIDELIARKQVDALASLSVEELEALRKTL